MDDWDCLLYNFLYSKISTVNIDYFYTIKSLINVISFNNSLFKTRLLDFPIKQSPFLGFSLSGHGAINLSSQA